MSYVVEMTNISKTFPGVVANEQVNLKVKKGEIHALVGENGAGKSTLMNILYGLVQPDTGEIKVHGVKVDISSPDIAISHGIGMVHQEFKLIQPFSIAENICLGTEPTRRVGLFVDWKKMVNNVEDMAQTYGLKVDPRARIQDCSVGVQQRVEILKALYRNAEVLVLDEPTAVLTPQETQDLFHSLRMLVDLGKSIIFITHKLNEVMAVSDTVTVMRGGKVVDSMPTAKTTTDGIATMMVGKKMSLKIDKKPEDVSGKPILQVKDLVVTDNRGLVAVNRVSFDVRPGEILAIAGIQGNGQTELVEALIGLREIEAGQFFFKDRDIGSLSIRQRRELGLGHISEERRTKGVNLKSTIGENLVAVSHNKTEFAKYGVFNSENIDRYAEKLIADFDIRTPSKDTSVHLLSGGNMQKVVVAREIAEDPELLIASQPTRGVDIGSIKFIHETMVDFLQAGKAVLLVSTELEEILALSDRIAVMYEGKIVAIVANGSVSEGEIGLLMAGVIPDRLRGSNGGVK